MKKLIGFVAGKQVGKTLASQYMCQKYGYVKFSIASPLKCALREIFSFTDEQLWGDKKEIIDEYWGVSPRFMMQLVGTDFFRTQMKEHVPQIGDNIWIKVAERKIRQYIDQDQYIVIDDVRFPNEAELIHNLGGILIRIERPFFTETTDQHESEQMNKFITVDETIINDRGISDYYVKIDQIMDKLSY